MLRESDLMRAVRGTANQRLPDVVSAVAAPVKRRTARHRPDAPGCAGLKNLGNTCFLNATLQCLFGCAEFCAPFVESGYALNASSPAKGAVAGAFAELLRDVRKGQHVCAPTALRAALSKIAPQFCGRGQHDCQELCRCLLDGLAKDLKRPPPPTPAPAVSSEGDLPTVVEEAHADAWRDYLHKNGSPVCDTFAGLLRSTVECCSCHHLSIRYDPYLDLSLPLPPPPPPSKHSPLSAKLQKGATSCTLEACLERFTAPEVLEEKITCERCRKPRRSKKVLSLQTWPPVLVLHVKRFSYADAGRAKLDTIVTFPTDGLDVSPFVSAERRGAPAVYDLFATTDHLGARGEAGHYVAHRKDAAGWRRFDDATHAPINADRLQGGGAYVLWYRRRDAQT